MPIYKITTPTGTTRVVEAAVQKSALNHVVKSDYAIEPLSAVQLAGLLRENPELAIEQVAAAPKDEAQADIEGTDSEGDDNGEE